MWALCLLMRHVTSSFCSQVQRVLVDVFCVFLRSLRAPRLMVSKVLRCFDRAPVLLLLFFIYLFLCVMLPGRSCGEHAGAVVQETVGKTYGNIMHARPFLAVLARNHISSHPRSVYLLGIVATASAFNSFLLQRQSILISSCMFLPRDTPDVF